MTKFKYFTGISALFIIAFFWAISFDAKLAKEKQIARQAECLDAVSSSTKKYFETLRIFTPQNHELASLEQQYTKASSLEEKNAVFAQIEQLGAKIISTLSTDNPAQRKLVDQLLGAANRRNTTIKNCTN